jgi:acetyl esterase/lipase
VTLQHLDPEIAAAVGAIALSDMSTETLSLYRQAFPPPLLSDAVVRTDHLVPGDPQVPVRVHRAAGANGLLPCVYSIHGGGYVLGSYTMDDARFDTWCPALGIVGVSVEYRLAPETPYPGPLEDCYRSLKWVYDNSERLGVDRNRVGIAGVSAGGGLAAALALLARDRGEVPLAFQLLDCPMLDDRQRTPSSQLDGLPVWSRETNTFGWRAYLGELYGTDDVPYTAAPARCTDLSGLPPQFRFGRHGRRFPRRGHRLCHAPQPGRRALRAARVSRRLTRLPTRRRLRDRPPVEPRRARLAREAAGALANRRRLTGGGGQTSRGGIGEDVGFDHRLADKWDNVGALQLDGGL